MRATDASLRAGKTAANFENPGRLRRFSSPIAMEFQGRKRNSLCGPNSEILARQQGFSTPEQASILR